jgi:hypothetical protein
MRRRRSSGVSRSVSLSSDTSSGSASGSVTTLVKLAPHASTIRWMRLNAGSPLSHARTSASDTPSCPASSAADSGSGKGTAGVAAVLVDALDCAVVSMRYPVNDEFAIAFVALLYEHVLSRGPAGRRRDRLAQAEPGCKQTQFFSSSSSRGDRQDGFADHRVMACLLWCDAACLLQASQAARRIASHDVAAS